jgi:hypothetical protein
MECASKFRKKNVEFLSAAWLPLWFTERVNVPHAAIHVKGTQNKSKFVHSGGKQNEIKRYFTLDVWMRAAVVGCNRLAALALLPVQLLTSVWLKLRDVMSPGFDTRPNVIFQVPVCSCFMGKWISHQQRIKQLLRL